MLIITRRPGEKIMLGDDVVVEVIEVSGSSVRIGIAAPAVRPGLPRGDLARSQGGERGRRRLPRHRAPQNVPAPRPSTPATPAVLPHRSPQEGTTTGCPSESRTTSRRSTRTASSSERTTSVKKSMERLIVRLPHQPRCATTRPASASPSACARRSAASTRRSATPRTASRWCRPPRARSPRSTRCSSASVSSPCSTRTARSSDNDRAAIQSEVNQLASRDRADRLAGRVQRHQAAERDRHDHVPGRRQRQRRRSPSRTISLGARSARPRSRCRRRRTTDLAEIDAAINAVSQQRATFGAVQNRLEHTLNGARRLPGEPGRRRVAHPRRGHGRGDGQPDEGADPAAGRPGDARAGQPVAAVGPVAPAGLGATRHAQNVARPDRSGLALHSRARRHSSAGARGPRQVADRLRDLRHRHAGRTAAAPPPRRRRSRARRPRGARARSAHPASPRGRTRRRRPPPRRRERHPAGRVVVLRRRRATAPGRRRTPRRSRWTPGRRAKRLDVHPGDLARERLDERVGRVEPRALAASAPRARGAGTGRRAPARAAALTARHAGYELRGGASSHSRASTGIPTPPAASSHVPGRRRGRSISRARPPIT